VDTSDLMLRGDGVDGKATAVSPTVVEAGSELTLRTAAAFVGIVRPRLEARPARLRVVLEDVKIVDAVGLAALAHATAFAARCGTRLFMVPSAAIYQGALQAGIAEELPFTDRSRDEPLPVEASPEAILTAFPPPVMQTEALALRQPRWDDLGAFDEWSRDPLLKTMVGSELLYRCRQLGPFHPEFTTSVLHHPTSLTLIVQAAGAPEALGFVRLYGIHLGQGFGFLETAIVSRLALRRGWGVTASRLLLIYAQDLLGLRRIEAKAYDYNRLSINALRRNGFKQEGILRGAAVHHGVACDIAVFGILDEEIREQRKREAVPYLGLWGTAGGPFFFEASDSRGR
jgi:RimJ/RimL family protein N-acetyltransferase/anti-anti-sigma regulatory factor